MIASATEHDLMMEDIQVFTSNVVGIAEMKDVPAKVRAEAIHQSSKTGGILESLVIYS